MKKIIILLSLMMLVTLASCNKAQEGKMESKQERETKTETLVSTGETLAKDTISLTMEEVSAHKTADDCYSVINGKVYDISSFFGKHKGGDEALLSLCGVDGTEGFSKMHGGQEKPERVLESFFKGDLSK